MTHKTNPISHRLGIFENWRSRYFKPKEFGFLLEEDLKMREVIDHKFKRSGIEKIEIERSGNQVKIFIFSGRPGLIIGRGGTGISDLRQLLEKEVKKLRAKKKKSQDFLIQLNVEEVKKPDISAQLVAENVALNLEKRMPFRRTIKMAVLKVMSYKEVSGVKIQVSGRLDGADIARREWVSDGKIPLITLRSKIDYGTIRASIPQGDIGIKVWVYKGE
ncbi:MAG: 30S ribosomal protein S3 [Candidatus Brennerbacteria bacterium RIFOXYC1_FULL_41_11]|uniref:Small ribosomal subunit protein uS3 n=1 Tax=Candidatus Brennerbacteria bacterium RIFOXYD1_FULL_41_16 TaxID=1797529 RepID=A0A1G1XKR3_9BACT|nr:MAG: 30S ribosomal protein S3 [Candidatus Brennerbacteria bacterium RIFOXYB1_FULL_41_13]OGY39047.1 MAG: 30S ribosomal protein S3 [Candidatus Brennerbacteria bacterium RIFOXYC1_FULL_41_11]OGY40200.1 MAG: 30S ribosomal protein S3 [Candidatus Brennerbacteria bacterium RIFOXYD1_FULL_41_16]HCJ52195.1 30S ribosomal protein S3 [Candidatus Kerfeldbacteria bacterium]